MPTPWRRNLYKRIKSLSLEGKVLDLGGSRKSGYHELIGGNHNIQVVNLDESYGYDLKFDLEKKFPVANGSYDAVTAFNVLEHVYDYGSMLQESFRVLKNGGKIVIGVPFLINIHGSPNDYWRYSSDSLKKILETAGFAEINIEALGKGPFTASCQLLSGVLKISSVRYPLELISGLLDSLLSIKIKKSVLASRYPLGYYVTARKA